VAGLPLRVHGDIPVEVGKDLPAGLDAEHAGRSGESGRLQVAQVLVHRGRPRAERAAELVTAPHDVAGHPAARQRLLAVVHYRSILDVAGLLRWSPAAMAGRGISLAEAISTGHLCSYRPAQQTRWQPKPAAARSNLTSDP